MAVLDSKKTFKNLKKKGFIVSPGDHKFLEFHHENKLVLHTKISHGGKFDIDDYLIKQMSVQCKLDKKQFMDLANCPLSLKEYLEILKGKKEL